MKYTKITLNFKYGPKDRFYRVVLVKNNPNLLKLGVEFATVLGTELEHCFLFTCDNNISYVMAPFMEMPIGCYKYLAKYYLKDLPQNFCFEYDTGDGWDFDCTIDETMELDREEDIILLEGKGQGVWEDNISTLYALFEGRISPTARKERPEEGIYKPWNHEIYQFGDFDKKLDIKYINIFLNKLSKRNYRRIREAENDYIYEYELDLDDAYEPEHLSFRKYLKEKEENNIK